MSIEERGIPEPSLQAEIAEMDQGGIIPASVRTMIRRIEIFVQSLVLEVLEPSKSEEFYFQNELSGGLSKALALRKLEKALNENLLINWKEVFFGSKNMRIQIPNYANLPPMGELHHFIENKIRDLFERQGFRLTFHNWPVLPGRGSSQCQIERTTLTYNQIGFKISKVDIKSTEDGMEVLIYWNSITTPNGRDICIGDGLELGDLDPPLPMWHPPFGFFASFHSQSGENAIERDDISIQLRASTDKKMNFYSHLLSPQERK